MGRVGELLSLRRNLISFPISILRAIGTPARKIAACAKARLANFLTLAFFDVDFVPVWSLPVVLWISDAMTQHLLSFQEGFFRCWLKSFVNRVQSRSHAAGHQLRMIRIRIRFPEVRWHHLSPACVLAHKADGRTGLDN